MVVGGEEEGFVWADAGEAAACSEGVAEGFFDDGAEVGEGGEGRERGGDGGVGDCGDQFAAEGGEGGGFLGEEEESGDCEGPGGG